jgi:hypothetical protein
MTESLRALLAGAIDYAGMFPPAALPLEQALANYRQHRSGPEAWMVGRFVCSAGELVDLAAIHDRKRDGKLAIIFPWANPAKTYVENLANGLMQVSKFPTPSAISTLEFRWESDELSESIFDRLRNLVEVTTWPVMESKPPPPTMFFELLSPDAPKTDTMKREIVEECVQQLALHNRTAQSFNCATGFKLRCGGADPAAVPSSAEVAAVICACRDAGVFWKATAGLHHPVRHVDPELGVLVHGFINLLTAAVMAGAHHLHVDRVQAILEDDDPWHFRFTNEALTWRDLSATLPQIAGARERSLRSFGSCSIDEPWHDLMVLGLV